MRSRGPRCEAIAGGALLSTVLLVHPTPSAAQRADAPVTLANDESALPAARDAEASLEVAVNRPDTRVLVDGRFVGYAPWAGPVAPGPHRVRLEVDGFRAWEGPVALEPSRTSLLRAVLQRSPVQTRAALSFSAAGLSGLAAGGLAVAAMMLRADLDSALARGRLAEGDGRLAAGTVCALGADVLGLAALGLAVTGLYFVLLDPPPRSTARLFLRRERRDNPSAAGDAGPAHSAPAPAMPHGDDEP